MYVDSKFGSYAGEYGLAVGRVHGVPDAPTSPSIRHERALRPQEADHLLIERDRGQFVPSRRRRTMANVFADRLLKMAEECERLADQCERLADQREQATHLSVVKV